jgi:hypothetical protein
MEDIAKLIEDPNWGKVEKLVTGYAERQLDITTIDLRQPAEHVKAELIGRITAYNSMVQFLQDTKIVSNKIKKVKNPFI